MPTGHDHWLEPSAADEAAEMREEARGEWIAERAEQLTAERLKDPDRVKDALSYGAGELMEFSLASFFIAFDAAQTDADMAHAAMALFRTMTPNVEARIYEDAKEDATREFDADARAGGVA